VSPSARIFGYELATAGTCESHTNGRCRAAANVQECEAARDELFPDLFVLPDVVSDAYPVGCSLNGVVYFNVGNPIGFTEATCAEFDCLCACIGTHAPTVSVFFFFNIPLKWLNIS
jgi:hypothetical protein